MKKFTTILFCLIILYTSSPGQKHIQQPSVNIKSISPLVNLLTVSVVDTAVAWTGGTDGANGVVFRTVNGGNDWGVDLFPYDQNVFNIFGMDPNTAFVAVYGNNETAIFRTSDGGSTWNNVFSSPGFINSVQMVSDTVGVGYAVRDPIGGQWSVLKTQNGGLNWNIISQFASIGEEYGYNNCVSWLDRRRGWFGTSGGRVYHTLDGGNSWGYAATPFDTVTAVAFPSEVGLSASSRGDIAGSINNGQNWFYLSNLSNQWVNGLSGVNLPSLTVWWAVSGTDFFATVDSGLSWFTLASAPEELYHVDVKFIPSQRSIIGWAVGKSGNVIRYKCTVPDIPTSPSPSTHSTGVSPMVTLRWSEAINCGYYYLEVSNDPSFDEPNLLIAEVLDVNSKTIGPLARNTTYYWKVFAENLLGYELSEIWDFTIKADTAFSVSISFPSSPTSSTDYRLFSIPGITPLVVTDILKSGNQKTDWRIYLDNGSEPFVPQELSVFFTFHIGEGYWLIKRGSLDISSLNVAMPPLNIYNEYLIDLHDGWNIIGNPFDRVVLAESIKTANGLSTFTMYQYDGSYTQSSVMEPFRGYYYFNGSTPLGSLAIPYPYILGNPPNNVPHMDWQVQLILETDINRDPENFIGISPNAKLDLDEFDNRKPPLVFDQGFLYFSHPEWDGKYSRFGS
ncbi:MAG TPA: hypothetical protein VFF29_03300, partial [Bacteroidota bacterium]|nr:hypothetical protein [Bacteroidota bacterium]